MKKMLLAIAVTLALTGPRWAYALSWGDIRDEFENNVRLTVLKSASPVYLYSFVEGKSLGGVETEYAQYRFFSADIGWANPFDAGQKGTIIGGASLHLDRLFRQEFPLLSAASWVFVPRSALQFWDRLFIGIYFGRNIDKSDLDVGLKSGIELKF